ncbi:hypothetical protein Scep_012720 [Stephania cephalantha]|uniref:Uncharacterized protein n=1 Tax=Stephania cephalantha TaxID=152367 RepID=A0AAP0P6R0_9MAGN
MTDRREAMTDNGGEQGDLGGRRGLTGGRLPAAPAVGDSRQWEETTNAARSEQQRAQRERRYAPARKRAWHGAAMAMARRPRQSAINHYG